jgi:hypothetical protein
MIKRFIQVTKDLFRGGAPSIKDVQMLKDKYKINKIISLDRKKGDLIDRACKMLNIKHIIIPIDGSRKSLLNFLSHDIKDLLLTDGPTFVHCLEGKDRTGLAVALLKVKYLRVDPDLVKEFEDIILNAKPVKDNNFADIVSNVRDYKGDDRDSFLDQSNPKSTAPYATNTVYNELLDQYPTRENYNEPAIQNNRSNKTSDPLVGIYNNSAGIEGSGPSMMSGGFLYD